MKEMSQQPTPEQQSHKKSNDVINRLSSTYSSFINQAIVLSSTAMGFTITIYSTLKSLSLISIFAFGSFVLSIFFFLWGFSAFVGQNSKEEPNFNNKYLKRFLQLGFLFFVGGILLLVVDIYRENISKGAASSDCLMIDIANNKDEKLICFQKEALKSRNIPEPVILKWDNFSIQEKAKLLEEFKK